MKKPHILALASLLWAPIHVSGQYYSDRPLEMSFEQSDLFFTPSFINPLGAGQFNNAMLLTSDHPLSALQRNPALTGATQGDSATGNFFYVDFGGNHHIERQPYYGIYPMSRMPGYWYQHSPIRPELTPLFSAAFITTPEALNHKLRLGLTYQLITQGERYYAIPYDIYKNVAGRSLDGSTYSGMESYSIEDRYTGADEMYHEGHAINAFAAWQFSDALSLGVKASRFIFERDGSLGSNNMWTQQIDYQSHWKVSEMRLQDYGHWDFSLGMVYARGRDHLGIHGGLLRGTVSQQMNRDDDSKSLYGQPGKSQYSNYQSWYVSDQSWEHEGNTLYGGFLWERQVQEGLDFRFMYNVSSMKTDIVLGSSIESESENEYYYSWNPSYTNESSGFSKMHDFRSGTGERNITVHRAGAALSWQLSPEQKLSFAAIYGSRNQHTETREVVDAFAESRNTWRYVQQNGENASEYYNKTVEDKTINWEYTTRLRSIQIPLIYEFLVGERFDVMAGISRTMNFWRTENETLILYDYRERVTLQETKIEHMTGERIVEPRERLSVVNTSLIGGVAFSPAPAFRIQLIISPGLEKNSLLDEYNGRVHVLLGMGLKL